MFGLFENSKSKEIKKLFRIALWNAVAKIDSSGGPEDRSLVQLADKLVKDWLASLPKHAVQNVSPSTLAAYVLVAESQTLMQASESEMADLYIEAAKILVDGLGLRMDSLHSDELQLMAIMAKLAKSSGLDFYSELAAQP
jgi:hypothetical protein